MYGANVIILEGILVLHSPEIWDMKVFVDTVFMSIKIQTRMRSRQLFDTFKTQPEADDPFGLIFSPEEWFYYRFMY